MDKMTGQECRAIRAAAGMTQVQFAARLGVTRLTVARWETGTREISSVTAIAIRSIRARRKKPN